MIAATEREAIQQQLAIETLRRSGELRFVARGGSMIPAIFPGDSLCVRRNTLGQVRRGDVVLFLRDERLYAHRVVRFIDRDGNRLLITRGDALKREDSAVAEDQLLGLVSAVVHRGRLIPHSKIPFPFSGLIRFILMYSDLAARMVLSWHSRQQMQGLAPSAVATGHRLVEQDVQ